MFGRVAVASAVLVITIFSMLPISLQATEADGSAIIKLQGSISQGNKKRITVAELEDLGVITVEINDPFEKKKNSFTGVMMEKFVTHYGNTGVKSVSFFAIDGYQITFSRANWASHKIMVATRVNDKYMDYENKGPLRIVYPEYDPDKHDSKEILPKWIWMITTVKFR
ncbi:hypothetical protein [Desulfopila sp. IMCC35008]|uniref:molybdopterin-dependent oxidoreductase n=1 Tax=Desulfopila sp. IMCC35008 TaxID=2653858 RepID=UPI0013D678BB|nr:hypothetical protein [Desulfopila sp. IMCC35008]